MNYEFCLGTLLVALLLPSFALGLSIMAGEKKRTRYIPDDPPGHNNRLKRKKQGNK